MELKKAIELKNGPRYIRYGECNMCGDCCENEDCEYFIDRKCIVFGKPERYAKCPLFPENPFHPFNRCSYYFYDKHEDKYIKPKDME